MDISETTDASPALQIDAAVYYERSQISTSAYELRNRKDNAT